MKNGEVADELLAFVLANAHVHPYACLAEHGYARAMHFGEWIDTADDDTRETALDEQLGTWRCFAPVRTRLKTDIDGRATEQRPVGHRIDGVDLGMGLAATAVPPLAYDTPTAHDDRPDHRVGCSVQAAFACQLDATVHESLIGHSFC